VSHTKKADVILIVVYSIAIIIGSTVIHEFGHFIAALSMGIPFNEIKVGFVGINPGVTIPSRFANIPHDILNYAGGAPTAVILLCLYLIIWYRKYHKQPSLKIWWYGFMTIMVLGWELGTLYLEGRFHAAYIVYAGSPFSVTNIFVCVVIFVALCFHFLFFPIQKLKKVGQR
jgi:hypothetical protein